jgi:hypothetical protein
MKQQIKWLIILILTLLIVTFLVLTFRKHASNNRIKDKLSRVPDIYLLKLDSTKFNLNSLEQKPLVLIHFNSECDHCQREAIDLQKHLKDFSNTNVVFMSSEETSKISKFANHFELINYSYIYFTKLIPEQSDTTFGNLSIPHTFIYGNDENLIKEFRGETSAKEILRCLYRK